MKNKDIFAMVSIIYLFIEIKLKGAGNGVSPNLSTQLGHL